MWEESREERSPPTRWNEFADAFIDHFLPAETKAARATEFESLKQGSMSMWEYHMIFVCLSNYAIYMFPTMEARVSRFVHSLNPLVINEAATTTIYSDMNYGMMAAFSQATETLKLKNRIEREGSNKARSVGNFGGSSGGIGGRSVFREGLSGPSQSFAQSSVSAQLSGYSHQQWSHFRLSQGNKGSYHQGRPRGRFQQQRRPPCPRCGKIHFGACLMDQTICYGCGIRGHIQRDCRSSHQSVGRGTTHPASSVATSFASPSPARGTLAPTGHGASRGGAQTPGGPSHFYAMRGRQKVFPDELLGIPPDRETDFGIDLEFVTFLGHVVSRERIKVDPQKIAAVKHWPRPTTPIEIRSFLGLARYYKKFLEGFSTLASLLTKLTHKAVKFQCLAHLEAYQRPLAKEVHWLASLGVRLADSSERGVIVLNRAESPLIVEVKEKQYDDLLLVQLKEGIHSHKTMTFSLGMDNGTLRYQG
ncbi:uncharacterized protein [Nicotiana tomentosiformis]|uniref:uncharacterized protein n=1 Tax=Nicotiana tomentosiformis TaxID=4098 RepID=UPI00388C3BBF